MRIGLFLGYQPLGMENLESLENWVIFGLSGLNPENPN